MLFEIFDFLRMPTAIALAVMLVAIIANVTIKTKVSPIEKTKTYVKSNLVQAVLIVVVGIFVFNELLKMMNNSISSISSREFWGQNVY